MKSAENKFKALYERKLKNMESRKERAHEFKLGDMEKIIGEVNMVSKSTKLLSRHLLLFGKRVKELPRQGQTEK